MFGVGGLEFRRVWMRIVDGGVIMVADGNVYRCAVTVAGRKQFKS